MSTISCPRCHQKVDSQAINCPYCRTQLKAYGHPGIPLHRAKGNEYLCESCTYQADDTCTFPQRPYAKECILYQNIEETKLDLQQQQRANAFDSKFKSWVRRNRALLLLLALVLVCILISVFTN